MKFIAPFHSSRDGRGICTVSQCTYIHYTFKRNTCSSLACGLFSGLSLCHRHLATVQAAPLECLQLMLGQSIIAWLCISLRQIQKPGQENLEECPGPALICVVLVAQHLPHCPYFISSPHARAYASLT